MMCKCHAHEMILKESYILVIQIRLEREKF